MAETIEQLLYQGALAVTQGRREEAQRLLLQIIERDEQNEQAWLWLSGAVDDPADQQVALENVLAINPRNQAALRGIEHLRGQAGGAPPAPAGEWAPPPPRDPDEVDELSCYQCGALVYSVAAFCWQCHAPIHCCNNCRFRLETRCKELTGLTSTMAQAGQNQCDWWRAEVGV